MARRHAYRWQNTDVVRGNAPVTTRVDVRVPEWREVTARKTGTCACGCGGVILPGMRVLIQRSGSRARRLIHTTPPR